MDPWIKTGLVVFGFIIITAAVFHNSPANTAKDGDRTYISDRTGERWDITQAVSIGFKPYGFQFGIGRNAIRPLDESHLGQGDHDLDARARVIGVENGTDAHAYVVRKLTRHEIANTRLGDTPIAAAY